MTQELKGTLTIARSHSNRNEEDEIRIYVEDESSRVRFLTVTMSLADFAAAITGLSEVPIAFDFYPAKVGMQREVKHEAIEVGETWNLKAEDVEVIVAPHEVDGWVADRKDVTNHHKRNGNRALVTFTRFVEVK